MSAKNLAPVKSLLDLLVDGLQDAITVEKSGKPVLSELGAFANLVGDVPALLAELPTLPGSLSGFDEPDAVTLIEYVIAKGVVSAQAQAVVNSALQAANALWAVYNTVKNALPPPAAAVAAPVAAVEHAAPTPVPATEPTPAAVESAPATPVAPVTEEQGKE